VPSEEVPLALLPHREYTRVIRPFLPPDAFRTSPRKIWGIALYTIFFFLGVIAVGHVDELWQRALLGLGLGFCVSNLAFYGHDLSHGSIVRNPWVRNPLEIWIWSLRLMPAIMWRRLHNETHHVFSNTQRDCDRQLLVSELNWPVRTLSRVVTPFDNPVRWSPIVGLAFVSYTFAHIGLGFLNGWRGGPSGPYTTAYRNGRLARMAIEVLIGIGIQVGILALVGWDLSAYIWCGPVPIAISSAVTMAYIFTNHFLNPITDVPDPVVGTTSVAVPRWVDWLHLNFSYHTEHHLFPGLNSDYYPLVGELLEKNFSDRYNRISIFTAWRRLWSVHLGGKITPSRTIILRTDENHINDCSKKESSPETVSTS